jgi:hypothetical protein
MEAAAHGGAERMKPTPNEGTTRKAWLLMLETGGRWTIAEIARKLDVDRKFADNVIHWMTRRDYATRYPNPVRKNGVCYGVTAANEVPRGVKLQDILAATGA